MTLKTATHPHPKRVLIADDDPTMLGALSDLIACDPGFEVVAAVGSVNTAIASALSGPPDIALVDVEMPNGGGERLAVALRKMSPNVRIVAHSAYDDSASVGRMIQAGADGYLVKTNRTRDLLSALSGFVAGEPLFEVPAHVLVEIARSYGDASLDQSERRFRAIVDGLPGYVYTCPLDFSRSLYLSRQALEITGYSDEDRAADPYLWETRLIHPDDKDRVLETFSAAMAAGEPVNCEYRINHKDGRVRWLRDHAVKVSGTTTQDALYQGVVLDITDAKEAELARAESLAKSRFLAGMSHEIRNPLNTVLGFAELLESGGEVLSEKQARFVRNIRASGQLLLDLVNDVLDFSKVQAGQMTAELQPLSVNEVVAAVMERMSPIADAKGVSLELDGDNCGAMALADRRRLTQVLLNLVSNGIKFTPAGGSVALSCAIVAEGVQAQVTDTGIGIALPEQARIFQEFVQVDNEETRSQTGTGLGLALSKGLMTLMGGSIGVASVPDHGSTFTITLQPAPHQGAVLLEAVASR
jgi:PAS domain S-box-containing protein